MIAKLIDLWNAETFDEELTAKLRVNAELIGNYMMTDRKKSRYQDNPYATDYFALEEEVGRDMEARTIRAWHYTRLTDAEVDIIRSHGIYPSTLETMRRQLDAQVAAGEFTPDEADALYTASVFHHQLDNRSNRFWMTTNPVAIDDGSVTLLLGHWGGESVYFWLPQDAALRELVRNIGVPRVLEMAVPLDATDRAYWAGGAVVRTFGRTLGHNPNSQAFNLCSMRALGPESVIAVHSQGEPNFAALAQGYPAGFTKR